ncbi:hypothetical protein FRC07_008907, partial [Ceratobasidium sp. 392]
MVTRYVPIRPAPPTSSTPRRPPALPAPSPNLDVQSPAISRFENNTTSETRHHVDPELSVLYSPATLSSNSFQAPLFDPAYNVPSSPYDAPRNSQHHALAAAQPRLRTSNSVNYGPNLSIPTNLPPTPRTTSRHTPRSPDKHTFAVPRVPAPRPSPPTATANNAFSPDYLQNYLNMISHNPTTPVDTNPSNMITDQELAKLIQSGEFSRGVLSIESDLMFLGVRLSVAQPTPEMNPTPFSTPAMPDFDSMRSLDELLASPEFASP